jgi:hypothetical protein
VKGKIGYFAPPEAGATAFERNVPRDLLFSTLRELGVA